jgi:hypothetical protein
VFIHPPPSECICVLSLILTRDKDYCNSLTLMLPLSERRAGNAWEPSVEVMLFLLQKYSISHFFPWTSFCAYSSTIQIISLLKMKILLGYISMLSCWSRSTFQRCVLPPSLQWVSAVRTTSTIRAIHRPNYGEGTNSETSVYFNETTQHCIPEGCHLHTRCREKLNSHVFLPSHFNMTQTM